MEIQSGRVAIATLAVVAAGFAACDDVPTDTAADLTDPPSVEDPAGARAWALLECAGTLTDPTLSCVPPAGLGSPAPDGLSKLIVGGQGIHVELESSDVAYDAGTQRFTFDVTLRNLLPQPLATDDGAGLHPDGARIFFHGNPVATVGSGEIAVQGDGVGTFTGSDQPFYQYDEVVRPGETTAPKAWTLIVPSSVEAFVFSVLVHAEVPFPDGFVDPGADTVFLQVEDTLRLSPVVRSATGDPLVAEGPFVFSTGDSAVVVVDEEGLVTALGAGEAVVTVDVGSRSGQLVVTVLSASRRWTGAVSSDWSDPGNWLGGRTPASSDSVRIPVAEAGHHSAVLTGPAEVGHLTLDDGATLDLTEFDLTVTGDVRTGTTGGVQSATGHLVLTGTDEVIEGVLPRTLVTGRYSLAGATVIDGPLTVRGGQLSGAGHLLRVRDE